MVLFVVAEMLFFWMLYLIYLSESIYQIVWMFLTTELVALVVFSLFFQLTVTVDERELKISFGIGLIKKAWQLEKIMTTTPVQTKWWEGFGIHYTSRGWLYNISGMEAVEIELESGRHFRIGTDEPRALIGAIKQAQQTS